jgi:hypothetical protein
MKPLHHFAAQSQSKQHTLSASPRLAPVENPESVLEPSLQNLATSATDLAAPGMESSANGDIISTEDAASRPCIASKKSSSVATLPPLSS